MTCHLPGFSALAEANAPEEALAVLRDYHDGLGAVILGYEATVGPLVEDRVMVLFNDPLPSDDPAGQAVRVALAMRERMHELLGGWRRAGFDLDFGVGIDLGYATLGTIGFTGGPSTAPSAPSSTCPPGCARRPSTGRCWSANACS